MFLVWFQNCNFTGLPLIAKVLFSGNAGFQTRWKDGFQTRWKGGFQTRWKGGFQIRWKGGFQTRWKGGFQTREFTRTLF